MAKAIRTTQDNEVGCVPKSTLASSSSRLAGGRSATLIFNGIAARFPGVVSRTKRCRVPVLLHSAALHTCQSLAAEHQVFCACINSGTVPAPIVQIQKATWVRPFALPASRGLAVGAGCFLTSNHPTLPGNVKLRYSCATHCATHRLRIAWRNKPLNHNVSYPHAPRMPIVIQGKGKRGIYKGVKRIAVEHRSIRALGVCVGGQVINFIPL